MRYQTEKLQRSAAGVAELVQLVWRNEDGRPRPQRVLAVAFQHYAFAFENEDLVFVAMHVFGRMAAGSEFELAHRKARRGVVRTDQTSNAAIRRSRRIDRRGLDLFAVDYFHRYVPIVSGGRYYCARSYILPMPAAQKKPRGNNSQRRIGIPPRKPYRR